jgi:hypothetical protein
MTYTEGGNSKTQQREGRSRETEPEMMAYLQAQSAAGASPASAEHAEAASFEADAQPEEREMPQRAMEQ